MTMEKKLLIVDLDNTLWDWLAYADGYLKDIIDILSDTLPRRRVISRLKQLHQRIGGVEPPVSLLCSIAGPCPDYSLRSALATNRSRHLAKLRVYDNVKATLRTLRYSGINIVGYTDSLTDCAEKKLIITGLANYIPKVYSVESVEAECNELRCPGWIEFSPCSYSAPKPNPYRLLEIVEELGFTKNQAVMVGDSLSRDVKGALDAGITAVHAAYGSEHSPEQWRTVESVTHWTAEMLAAEEAGRESSGEIVPDVTLSNFIEVIDIFNIYD